MNIKDFFRKNYIHFIALGVFLIVGYSYFNMQFSGYALIQHDIEQGKGMAAEAMYHDQALDENIKWNNSMFGGMPMSLISPNYEGNLATEILRTFRKMFSLPFGAFFLHLICFYIFGMLLRIKPLIAMLGAFAFAFASYEIVILQAGHNTKSIAVAFLPAVLGAFIYAFRTNWKIGGILTAIFLSLEIACNHPQVTYYMGFLLLAIGIYFGVEAIKKKEYKPFIFSTLGVLAAVLISGMVNYGYLTGTTDYAKYSIRGGNDIKEAPTGEMNRTESGLEIDYITNWSLDRGETFTFVSPYVRGSHSAPFENSRFEDLIDDVELDGAEAEIGPQLGMYWGNQPGVAGPFYMGVVVVFLALLALVFVKKPLTYILFGISVLMVFLSWGKNLMWLTEFFVNNVALYDNFRTVTIALVIVELCMSVLGVLLLQHLYTNREDIKLKKKHFLIASGVFVVFLFGLKFSGSGFSGAADQNILDRQEEGIRRQIAEMDQKTAIENGIDKNNQEQINQIVERQLEPVLKGIDGAKKLRKEMYASSTTRSLILVFFAIGILSLFFYSSLPAPYIVAGLGVLILIDLIPVDQNYLGSDLDARGNYKHWMEAENKRYPIASRAADEKIFQLETQGNQELLALTQKGVKKGTEKADELGYEGDQKRRVEDFFRFRALAAATHYRVIDLSSGWGGAWNSSENAYLHKSLGGYHAAKLNNIQNLFDFQLSNSNDKMFDMMNVKYIIRGDEVEPNTNALGNAWGVKKVMSVKSPDEEIRALGKSFNFKNVGNGTLLINGVKQNSVKGYAFQSVRYVIGADTLNIPISNAIQPGNKAYAISAEDKKVSLIPEQIIAADSANTVSKLVEITGLEDFNPASEAVMLDEFSSKLSQKEFTGEVEVNMTSYHPDRIEYEIDAKGKQLVVFSEIYYPDGWVAMIDGKEVDILKVNYLLRGLEIGSGNHKVVFKFDAPKHTTRAAISWIGSILLALVMATGVFLAIKPKYQ